MEEKKKYMYVHYRVDSHKIIRDVIVGINGDYYDIDKYIEEARKIIAKRWSMSFQNIICSMSFENIIVMDYKFFGTELNFIDCP